MLISYEEKLRIAQESLRQPSVNQIAEATGIHRSVVQKALNDPEIIELQETFKVHVLSRYVNSFPVDVSFASKEAKSNVGESNGTESNVESESNTEVELNQLESSVSEEVELRIREVEALESIATSLVSFRSMFEEAAKQKIPTQEELDE